MEWVAKKSQQLQKGGLSDDDVGWHTMSQLNVHVDGDFCINRGGRFGF